jgi:hypothetical protein
LSFSLRASALRFSFYRRCPPGKEQPEHLPENQFLRQQRDCQGKDHSAHNCQKCNRHLHNAPVANVLRALGGNSPPTTVFQKHARDQTFLAENRELSDGASIAKAARRQHCVSIDTLSTGCEYLFRCAFWRVSVALQIRGEELSQQAESRKIAI